jgi:hypothetical protein
MDVLYGTATASLQWYLMVIMSLSLQMGRLNLIVLTHTVIPQDSSYQFTSYPSLEIRKYVTGFQISRQLLLTGNPSSRKQTLLPAEIHGCFFPTTGMRITQQHP